MTLVPLPAVFFEVYGGRQGMQILTRMPLPCRPRRLVIPQWTAVDFNIVGVGVVRGDVVGVTDVVVAGRVERGPWWPEGHAAPAHIFSEAFKELNVEILLPALRTGDHVLVEISNLNPVARRFSGGWLVEPMVEK